MQRATLRARNVPARAPRATARAAAAAVRHAIWTERLHHSQRRQRRQKGSTMNKKQWALAFVLTDFLALNAYAVSRYGYLGFMREAVSTLAGVAVLVDLTIALTLVLSWLLNDARKRGIAASPYVVATLLLGSVGPLAYLLRTSGDASPVAAEPRLAARSA
jgi:hypothetical protein